MSQENKLNSSLRIDDIMKAVTTISGAIAGLGFIFYALGFIVVNSYLSTFGIHEFDILKPSYLSAGVVFVFANTLIIAIPVGLGLILLKIVDPKSSRAAFAFPFFGTVFVVVFSFLFATVIINFLTAGLQSDQGINLFVSWKQYGLYSLSIFIFASMSALIAFMLVGLGETPGNIIKDTLSDKAMSLEFFRGVGRSSIFLLLAIFLLLTAWSHDIYPRIGAEFGGGKPATVQIVVLDSNNQSLFTAMGIDMNSNVSEKIRLIDENDNYVTVVTNKGNAIRITKSLLASIVFLNDGQNNVVP